MIRVAVVMGKMHSGGKKNLVMEYYRHIDRNKIQFDFICDSDSNAIPKEEIISLGGRIYEVAPYQHIIKNMYQIYRICMENKYLIIHGYNNTLNVFPMFVGKVAGVPIRINESISMSTNKGDWKTYIKEILKPFSHCFATNFMANGETCGRWQFGDKAYNKGKVKIFKTVIDADNNDFDMALRENTRREYDLVDNLVIGHIGRLTEQKNTLFLIDVVNEIVKIDKRVKLLIIGDGNLREAMIEKISNLNLKENIIYLGRREDIKKFYNAMDCFVLPSLYEGLPVVGVEAECCGLPVFFSTEIPQESSACNELSHYISLEKNASEWAKIVLKETKKNIISRRSRIEEIRKAGFDSAVEGVNLEKYYLNIV